MLKAGQKHLKKASIPELANEIFNSPIANNLDKHLLVAEVLWNESRKVIFPGGQDFFTNLLKSNFSLEGSASLNLPNSSFILAMPKGFEVDGVCIPSVIVNYNKASERMGRYDQATKIMGLPEMSHQENNLTGSDSLSFFYQCPYEDDGVTVQVNQTPSQVGSALKAASAEEYAAILGNIPKDMVSPIAVDPSSSDYAIQFAITKIIAGISVYMSANNITQLVDGLPNNGRLAITNMKADIKYSFSHLPLPPKSANATDGDVMTTRSFHFRQLRDERFYRNEHEHLQPGSRWVFVKEAQVGKFKAEHIK